MICGVTAGYGDSCTVSISAERVAQLPQHLYTYLGCGLGRWLEAEDTRAVLCGERDVSVGGEFRSAASARNTACNDLDPARKGW